MEKVRILLTGGAGYIGSHTALALLDAGFVPIIIDNFANANPDVVDRLTSIAGQPVKCICGDVCDETLVRGVLKNQRIRGVIHFASHKAVGESVVNPLKYYGNNLIGAVSVLRAMHLEGVKSIVFSSSATVYGNPDRAPVAEDSVRSFTNPYAHIKIVTEDMLHALRHADSEWSIAMLRYFNPVGAHSSGRIGEDPRGTPNNLMPYVAQVAIGKRPFLRIFGNDYPTEDGTGVRDYIHVMDLAEGHVCAITELLKDKQLLTVNLGTGRGTSVLQIVRAFERCTGQTVPFEFMPRRPGDVPTSFADVSLARKLLDWEAKRSLDEMCLDTWRWQSGNPARFDT
jgi:UDP-glucose 4-epimerase